MSHFDFLICTLETCVLTSEFYALMQYARKKKKKSNNKRLYLFYPPTGGFFCVPDQLMPLSLFPLVMLLPFIFFSSGHLL